MDRSFAGFAGQTSSQARTVNLGLQGSRVYLLNESLGARRYLEVWTLAVHPSCSLLTLLYETSTPYARRIGINRTGEQCALV